MLKLHSRSTTVNRSAKAILVIAGLLTATTAFAATEVAADAASNIAAGATTKAPADATTAPQKSKPSVANPCPNNQEALAQVKYPLVARWTRVQGEVLVDFTVSANGKIKNVKIKSSPSSLLSQAAFDAVRNFKCVGQGKDVQVQVPFFFKLP